MQKANVSINLTGGIDTKTDEKLVVPTKLTNLENGVFTRGISIAKRPGYDALAAKISNNTNIVNPQALQVYNDELLMMADKKLYSYDVKTQTYVNKGILPCCSTSIQQIASSAINNYDPDGAVVNNVGVYAWHKIPVNGLPSVDVIVRNELTGTIILSRTLSINGAYPRVVVTGAYVHVVWVENNTIIRDFIVNTNNWLDNHIVTLFSDAQRNDSYSVCSFINDAFIIVYKKDNVNLTMAYVLYTGVVASIADGYPNPILLNGLSNSGYIPIDVRYTDQFPVGMIFVSAGNLLQGIEVRKFNTGFTQDYPNNILDGSTAAKTLIMHLTSICDDTGIIVYYSINDPIEVYVNYGTLSYTLTDPVGDVLFCRSVSIAGTPFVLDTHIYLPCVFSSSLQSTYFLMNDDTYPVAKAVYQRAGAARKTIPNSFQVSPGIFALMGLQKQQVSYDNGTFFYSLATTVIHWDFVNANIFSSAVINNNLFIAGSIPSSYDGRSIVESGFLLFPENIKITKAATGGTIVDGTYTYQFTFEWTDNVGNIQRSALSPPYLVRFDSGTTNQVTFEIPTLKLTYKQTLISVRNPDCWINVWRTDRNSTVLYRIHDAAGVGSVGNELRNRPVLQTVTFIDTNAGFSTSAELLYTTGGVLENDAPASCHSVTVSKNRAFLVGLEDPNAFAYSKEAREQVHVSFSSLFVKKVDPTGGPLTAIAAMDGKEIFFKQQNALGVDGDGPLDTGLQDTFTEPQLISTDVGCTNPNSIVLMPRGLMFKSSKGIYLLDRGLNVSYLGADVEKYNDLTITSADLLQSQNEVRFKTLDGVTLVYNYFFNQWGTFTNGLGIDAVIWQGKYSYLRSTGRVYVENQTKFKDDLQTYKLTIETAWIKLTGIQDYQRVSHALVLGQFKSAHDLLMSVAYDYQPYYVSHHQFNASDVLQFSRYGDVSNYGDESPYGGDSDGVYQFRVHIERQKCESIRFKFEDQQIGAGQSYIINNLTLQIGQKSGSGKFLKSNKTI